MIAVFIASNWAHSRACIRLDRSIRAQRDSRKNALEVNRFNQDYDRISKTCSSNRFVSDFLEKKMIANSDTFLITFFCPGDNFFGFKNKTFSCGRLCNRQIHVPAASRLHTLDQLFTASSLLLFVSHSSHLIFTFMLINLSNVERVRQSNQVPDAFRNINRSFLTLNAINFN